MAQFDFEIGGDPREIPLVFRATITANSPAQPLRIRRCPDTGARGRDPTRGPYRRPFLRRPRNRRRDRRHGGS